MTRRTVALGLAAVVLAGAAAGAATATRDDDTDTRAGKRAGKNDKKQQYEQLFVQRLATRLGVSPARLRGAGQAAAEDVIARALKDGTITKQQADRLREHLKQEGAFDFGLGGLGKRDKGARMRGLGRIHGAVMEAVAKRLGLTRAEIDARVKSGKTLADLAKAKGLTMQQLGRAAADAVAPVLNEMVKAGKLTRERANAILDHLRSGRLRDAAPAARKAA